MNSSPFHRTQTVERRSGLSRADFEREYLAPSRPLVLAGVFDPRELERWSATLASSPARVACVVARSGNLSEISDADRPRTSEAASHPERNEFSTELPLAEILHRMRAPSDFPPLVGPGETLYVFSVPWPSELARPPVEASSVPGEFAELLFADPRPAQLLVNGPGMLNRAHCHLHSYFLQQLHGRKRVRLFSPGASPRLYHNGQRRSTIADFDAVDPARFPRIAEVEAWEAILSPGDVLFLPTYWWHEIRVDELAVSMGTHAPQSPLYGTIVALQRRLAAALEEASAGGEWAAPIAALVLETSAHSLAQCSLQEVAGHLSYLFDDPR